MARQRPRITVIETGMTYWIECFADGTPGITCRPCHLTSFHPEDIANRFCGKCGRWHLEPGRSPPLTDKTV